jgi:preprotein translocase SecE subunit
MAKAQGSSSFWAELLKVGLYKRNQGRLARQLTGAAIAVIVAMGAWRLSQSILSGYVDSYWAIEVAYTATERNSEFDETIREIAKEYDPTAIFVEGGDADDRTLEILLPTSVFYETDQDLDIDKKKLAKKIRTQLKAADPTWDTIEPYERSNPVLWITYGIPFGVFAAGAWIAYRLVNYPRYVDFLVAVEAEIDKVTWASRQQLYRYTVVVVATMFLMGVVLFVYDVFWQKFFKFIGFLQF